MFYSNHLVGSAIYSDEYIASTYVFLIFACYILYRFHKKLNLKKRSSDFNNAKTHTMDNYTFSFTNTDIAITSSSKKIGIFTKMVVWGLIALFVVTPIYSMIPKLEPIYYYANSCFGFYP